MIRWFGQWRKTRETPGATNIKIKKPGEADEIKRNPEKDTRKKKENILPRGNKKAGAIPEKTTMTETEMEPDTTDAGKVTNPVESNNKAVIGQVSQPVQLVGGIIEEKVNQTVQDRDEVAISEPEDPMREGVSVPRFLEERSDSEETGAALSKLNSQTIYTGNIELAIDAPVDLYLLSQLYDSLLTIPQLRILRTSGSLKRGARIKITLEKSMPLLGNLSAKIPGIQLEKVMSENEGKLEGKLNYGFRGEKEAMTIKIALKNNLST